MLASLAWILEGSPVPAFAVLVIATPCPLILAAPGRVLYGLHAILSQHFAQEEELYSLFES